MKSFKFTGRVRLVSLLIVEVEEALRCWKERGWVKTTDGRTHISQAAYEYLR